MSGDADRWYFAKIGPMGGHIFGKSMKRNHYDEIISCLHEDFSCRGMLCWRNIQNEPVISAMILCPATGDHRYHMCLYLLLRAYLFKLNSLHQRTDECDIRVSPKR